METADGVLYRVFVRNWWKLNSSWPNGLEPDPSAHKRYIAKNVGYDEARRICANYNKSHKPGRLSRKAEFEQTRD